jgi:hypothetical protein
MHCVETLTVGAITALGAAIMVDPRRLANGGTVRVGVEQLGRLMKIREDLNLVMGFVSELRGLNLVYVVEGMVGPRYENTGIHVTGMGVRLARFIEGLA